MVDLADVKAETTECDSNQVHATTRETGEAAAALMRSMDNDAPLQSRGLRLYGASPLVEAKGRGTLTVQRLDIIGERYEINLGGTQLKGRFIDFASENVALVPGGLYAASFQRSRIVFRVDLQAKNGATPRLSAACCACNSLSGPPS